MQPYIIKSLKRINDNAIFELAETGTNSGGYVFEGRTTEVKRLRDFLCDGNFIIWSVYRQDGANENPTRISFTIGDRLSRNLDGSDIISSIKVVNSEIIISTGTTNNSTIRLVNANKFVEPQLRTTRTTTRGPRPIERTSPLDEVETLLLSKNVRKIRIQGLLIKRNESLKQFLIKFFKEWNDEKDTIHVDDRSVQTGPGRRRSLGDIYMICKYYYPNCTLNEVLNLLYNTLPTVITNGFRSSYCHTINKRVWYFDEGSNNGVYDKTTNDEFGKPHRFYIDNITA